MPALPARNNLRTTLTAILNISDPTVQVVSTAGFPSEGIVSVDQEIIYYTGKTSTEFTGLTRGFDNTTAAVHTATTKCNLRIIAKHIDDAGFLNAGAVPVTVGGIVAGSTFPARLTAQEMLNLLLYPTINPGQVAVPASLTVLDALPIANFRTIEWLVESKKGTNVQIFKIVASHDGTNPFELRPVSMQNGSGPFDITIAVSISGGNIRLTATPLTTGWTVTWTRQAAMAA